MKISTMTTALTLALAVTVLAGDAPKEQPKVDRSSRAESTDEWFARYDTDKDGRITTEEFRGGKTLFTAYDLDKDGVISRDEVKAAKKIGGPSFRTLDTDKDGFVTRREWQGTQEEFDAVDHDRDGVWSKADLAIDKRMTQARGTIERLDANKDGVISADEWHGDASSFRLQDLNRNGKIELDELVTPVSQ